MSETIETPAKAEAFTFGDPMPMMSKRDILDYLECISMGKWYEPPVSFSALAKTSRSAVHHGSAMQVKRNILVSCFKPNKYLSTSNFAKFLDDFIIFGNGVLERTDSRLGNPLKLDHALMKYTRRGTDLDQYYYVTGYRQENEFKKGSIFHLIQPDVNQEVYGMPEYLAAINSVLLNESATLFRRRYFENGSHAGFILYMTDAAQEQSDVDKMREALKNSKGPGNFRNLFMYAPNGKKDGIQLLPISEVAAKDDFLNIKNVSRDDMLAMHRVPPQLMGVVPTNTGGFGDPSIAAEVFSRNELEPLQARFKEINEWIGEEVIDFNPYVISKGKKNKK